jgi:hypothetical protein
MSAILPEIAPEAKLALFCTAGPRKLGLSCTPGRLELGLFCMAARSRFARWAMPTIRPARQIGFVFRKGMIRILSHNPFPERQLSLIREPGNWLCFA